MDLRYDTASKTVTSDKCHGETLGRGYISESSEKESKLENSSPWAQQPHQ
jgi:hypothetical protein